MNITTIIAEIIVFAVAMIAIYFWRSVVKPYIEDKHLTEIANIVVHAAESMYGAGRGEEKLAYAIAMINTKFNIDLDDEKIRMAIEAAWKAMDINQKN